MNTEQIIDLFELKKLLPERAVNKDGMLIL